MSEKLIREWVRQLLKEDRGVSTGSERIPWPQPELFFAAGNGRGRGEFALAAALAGATVQLDDATSADIKEKQDRYNSTKKKIKGKTNPEWQKARDALDAAGIAATPQSIVDATGQGQGTPYDVRITQDNINAMNSDPSVSMTGTPQTQYMDINIEVKEPGPGNTFRMASEGMAFISTLRGTTDYTALASQINRLQIEFNQKVDEIESETQLDLFDPSAGVGTVSEVPNEILSFIRTDGAFFDNFANIASGEGAMIPDRLKIMYESTTAMKSFASGPVPGSAVAQLIYNAVKDVVNGLTMLKNAYMVDPELMSSQEVFFDYLISTRTASRALFESGEGKANVEYIAFVTPEGYQIFPTDMETLFSNNLLRLVSISQGRPKFKVGEMLTSEEPLDDPQSLPNESMPEIEIEVPEQIEMALEGARLVRHLIREALLTEAFTKTDERQIGVMARKEIDAKWKDHEKKIQKMFDERDKTLFRNDAFYKVIARIYQELQRAYAEDQFKYATRYTRKDIPLARFRPS